MVLLPALDRLRTLRALALAAIVTNVGIVVTGGIVRLTGSGLGCPDWPTCDGDQVLPSPGGEAGWHQAIEFGNRLLTFVVLAVAIAAWVSARRAAPAHRDLHRVALALPVGVLAQAVLGGITVLTDLNPLVVAAHFLLSMGLIAVATVLHHRVVRLTGHVPDGGGAEERLAGAALVLVGLAVAVLVLGTLVTASGPHAGDPGTPRLGLDIRAVARVHAGAVWVTVLTTVGVLVAAVRTARDGPVVRAAAVLLAVEVVQGAVGYLQYALGVPAELVGLHLLLASLFWVAVVRVALVATTSAGSSPEADAPVAVSSA